MMETASTLWRVSVLQTVVFGYVGSEGVGMGVVQRSPCWATCIRSEVAAPPCGARFTSPALDLVLVDGRCG
jgi:hypothetical protein